MFDITVFHEDILNNLIKSVKDKKNNHAYIFSGEQGLYRHNAAYLFANALVCESEDTIPCGKCRTCILCKNQTNTDIKIIVPEEGKKSISIEQVRSINADASIKPFISSKKIYIIDGDLLNEASQNGLLKTLEEPPPYAVFIIICQKLENLLPTICSRCTKINFLPVSDAAVHNFLLGKHPDLEGALKYYVSFSMGNPGRAEALISDSAFSELRGECLKKLKSLFSKNMMSSYVIADFFDANKERGEDILNVFLLFLRDILMIYEGQRNNLINGDYTSELSFFSTDISPEIILKVIDEIVVCNRMLKNNISLKYIGMYLALSVKKLML